MLDALQALICDIEQDDSLEQPERLRERVHAMDRLEDLLLELPCPPPTDETAGDALLRQRAHSRHATLADIQRQLCQAIRQAIMQGAGTHALRGWARRSDLAHPHGYDHLDALVGDVLSFEEPTTAIAELDAEMVFYQPTPARHVFDMIERAAIDSTDVLVDLGSGMGHVPLLVSILSGARCIGIERETVYAESACQCAQALRLDNVEFIAQDVRDADFSRGTLFYLYTPFSGGILHTVLQMLRHEANRRPIRIATLGPCTALVAKEPWLTLIGPQETDRITLFQSMPA